MYFFFMKEILNLVWYFLVSKFMPFWPFFTQHFVCFFQIYIYVLFEKVCCRYKTKSNKDMKIQIVRIHKKTEPYRPYLVKCHKYVQCKLCDDKCIENYACFFLFFFTDLKDLSMKMIKNWGWSWRLVFVLKRPRTLEQHMYISVACNSDLFNYH